MGFGSRKNHTFNIFKQNMLKTRLKLWKDGIKASVFTPCIAFLNSYRLIF